MLQRLESPKLNAETRRTSIYPYYAGFSEAFVQSLIEALSISEDDLVADPWNGSGTTTAVCSRLGIPSIGIDINPAMKPVAAFRAAFPKDVERASLIATRVFKDAASTSLLESPFYICGELLSEAKALATPNLHDILRFGFMVTCRNLAKNARSRNPTWFSGSELSNLRCQTDEILAHLISTFESLRLWTIQQVVESKYFAPRLITKDALVTKIRQPVTHIVTSPPYLTRIDYVMKTLPELFLLDYDSPINIQLLRKNMLGGVLTSIRRPQYAIRSPTSIKILGQIRSHKSKASSTYYF